MNRINNKKIAAFYIGLVIMIIILVNSGITAELRNWFKITIPNLDKIVHFFGMGTLAFVLNLLFYRSSFKNISLTNLAGFFIAILLSTIEEFSQKFLIYRSFSYADLAANYLGIISFTLFYFLLNNKSNYFKYKYLQS